MEPQNKYEFGVQEAQPKPTSNNSFKYMGISLVVVSLALVGVVVALIFQIVNPDSDSKSVLCKPEDIQGRYPGYFRTLEQQMWILEKLKNETYAAPTVPLSNCRVTCPLTENRQTRGIHRRSLRDPLQEILSAVTKKRRSAHVTASLRRKRQTGGDIYHGCCSSQSSDVTPDEGETILGESVTIVQLDDYKQYFKTQSCVADPSCTICTCAQPVPVIYNAVVYADEHAPNEEDKYKTVYIKLPGCCKCLNIRGVVA